MTTLLNVSTAEGFTYEGPPINVMLGKVCVEMGKAVERYGGLYVPDWSTFGQPSVGRVIGAYDGVAFGALVCVVPDDGLQMVDEAISPNEIRFYGHWWDGEGFVHEVDWRESVLFEIMPTGYRAFGTKVVIEPDEVPGKTAGGIWLPDSVKGKAARGRVVTAGSDAHDLHAGLRVGFDPNRAPFTTTEGYVVTDVAAVLFIE